MKLSRTAVSIVLAAVVAGITVGVAAQELTGTLKKVKETGAITIGHRESSIPFSYLDDKQQPIGYAMDLCMKVADAVMKSGEIEKIYAKWFLSPIAPKGVNLHFPMTPALKEAFVNPNDKGV